MSVKIRLTRTGARNAAAFRVVAADARSPRDGRFIEILGWYDPKIVSDNFKIKLDRIEFWANQGAEISDTVKSLVKRAGTAPQASMAPPSEVPVAELSEEAVDEAAEVPAAEAVVEEEEKALADA
ncbi:MAG: 30S ribosomal protein S16 [Lentisphaerae bacterium]|nr:30S ribosomal protein S16 [Lentisphaerota bacterium]